MALYLTNRIHMLKYLLFVMLEFIFNNLLRFLLIYLNIIMSSNWKPYNYFYHLIINNVIYQNIKQYYENIIFITNTYYYIKNHSLKIKNWCFWMPTIISI